MPHGLTSTITLTGIETPKGGSGQKTGTYHSNLKVISKAKKKKKPT